MADLQLSNVVTGSTAPPEEPKPTESPIAYEDKQLPSSQLDQDYLEKSQTEYVKHIASKIRENYPDLKDATDNETYAVIKKVEMPDASDDEAWKALTKVYGGSFVPPKPPLISTTEPSTIGAMVADIPVSIWQDITATPKGISEIFQGTKKVKQGEVEEGQKLLKQGQAHLTRGGAFALGLMVSGGVSAELEALPVLNKARSFFPRLIQNALKGSVDVASFMAPYEASRSTEAEATPAQVLEAFMHGASSGAKFGAVVGAGGTVGSTILSAARAAGVAAKEAKTLAESKAAAAKFANIFNPKWAEDATDPKAFAEEFITKMYGPDVASSKSGKQTIDAISKKIKDHQDNLVKTAFVDKPLPDQLRLATGFLEGESPEAFAAKKQLITPQGPAWNVVIETSPGTHEVHNVFAKTQDDAIQLAQQKAGSLGGTVTKVEPQFERRMEERRGAEQKINPEATLLIGRGQNGQVRVEFPSKLYADLYAFAGRAQQSMRGGKQFAAGAEADRLSAALNLDRSRIFSLSEEYRNKIKEITSEHKPYDETGEVLKVTKQGELIKPDVERRQAERRVLKPEQVANLDDIASKARTELSTIESASGAELIQRFKDKYPDKTVPGDTEEIRTFFRNEAEGALQGAQQLRSTAEMEAPRLQLELATPAEVTKALVNPKFKEEFERLHNAGASDAEILNVVQRSMKDRYGSLSSELASEGGRVYGGFDPSLIKKLAAKMYKGEIETIVPKELLQNAIDAVRGREGGKINVYFSEPNRSIRVTDNGSGMSPEVVKRELVDLGSSLKPEGSSGGFGLAKAALFANAKYINISTVADVGGKRIRSTLEGSGDDWANSQKGLNFETKEVGKDSPTGTSIELRFPEQDADGNPISWSSYGLNKYADNFLRHNRTGIPITMQNGALKLPLRNFVETWKPSDKIDTTGATLNFYQSGVDKEQTYVDVQVLNRGVPQFEISYPFFSNAVVLPEKIAVDISSKVTPDNALYPFTTNREEVTPEVKRAILNYLNKYAGDANIRKSDIYRRILVDSPRVGGENSPWKLIDPTESRPPELMKQILDVPEYHDYLARIDRGLTAMKTHMARIDKAYDKLNLHGLSTNQKHLGSNILGKSTIGSDNNLMLINPWTIMDEVFQRVNKKITGESLEDIADDFAEQTISTIVHELTHQVARGHNESFAGYFTRNMGLLRKISDKVYQDLMEGLKPNGYRFINQITKHSIDFLQDANKGQGKNLLETVGDASTANRPSGSNPRIPENGPKGRTQSTKVISTSGGNPVKGIRSGTKGRGNLSTIIEKARQMHNIPTKTPEEAQVNIQDYLPVQELGREEIPVD